MQSNRGPSLTTGYGFMRQGVLGDVTVEYMYEKASQTP